MLCNGVTQFLRRAGSVNVVSFSVSVQKKYKVCSRKVHTFMLKGTYSKKLMIILLSLCFCFFSIYESTTYLNRNILRSMLHRDYTVMIFFVSFHVAGCS